MSEFEFITSGDILNWEAAYERMHRVQQGLRGSGPRAGSALELVDLLTHVQNRRSTLSLTVKGKTAALNHARFDHLTLLNCTFDGCSFQGTNFAQTIFESCIFARCDLRGAKFTDASCQGVEFVDCVVNDETSFHNLTNPHCMAIDRNTLLRLGQQRGGLSDYDLSLIWISDDVASLRAQFTGFSRLIHVLAIVGFFSPYAIFLAWLWINTLYANPDGEYSISILRAFAYYLASGGAEWERFAPRWLPLVLLVVMLSYNAVRIVLFWHVDRLDTRHKTFGVPPSFSFEDSVFKTSQENNWAREHVGWKSFPHFEHSRWLVRTLLSYRFIDGTRRLLFGLKWMHLNALISWGAFIATATAVAQLIVFGMRELPLPLVWSAW